MTLIKPEIVRIKHDLALAYRIMSFEGHGDTVFGILAARNPDDATFWIKSMAYGMDEVTPETLLRMDLEGNAVEGDDPVHSEWPMFAEIFRFRADVGGIVHTHAPHCCMLAAAELDVAPYDQYGVYVMEIAWFKKTPNRVSTPKLARAIVESLGGFQALFIKHHGIVTVGGDIREAALLATFLEKAARRQVLNMLIPGAQPMSKETAEELRATTRFDRMLPAIWAYYKRRLQFPTTAEANDD